MRRVLALFGYAAAFVPLSSVTLATVLDPAFSWRSRSLSSIGEATETSLVALSSLDQVAFDLFNGGLLLSGLLGGPFVVALWLDADTRFERAGVVSLAVTLLGNVGVGVAYLDGPYTSAHFLAAMTFFYGVAVTLWLHGSGLVRRTDGDRGVGTLWLANGYVLTWALWILVELQAYPDDDVLTWFAVPEYAAAVAIAVWVAAQARRLLDEWA